MNIVLDSSLERVVPKFPNDLTFNVLKNNIAFNIERGNSKKEYIFTHSVLGQCEDEQSTLQSYQMGYVAMLAYAYNWHEKIEFGPHDLWYIVLTELANAIKTNVDICRPMFTASNQKVDICIPTDNPADINLDQIINKLKDLFQVDIWMFTPTLTTANDTVKLAMYAALCDGVQEYYSYSTFCCGIPEICVTGTKNDWMTLANCAYNIGVAFKAVGFDAGVKYINAVRNLLEHIVTFTFTFDAQYSSETVNFWKDIFTLNNIGSGGELEIDGWITTLFFTDHPINKLENFTSNLSVVPFTNTTTGCNFVTVHGCLARWRTKEGFLRSGYGSIVYEEIPKMDSVPVKQTSTFEIEKVEVKANGPILYREYKLEPIRDVVEPYSAMWDTQLGAQLGAELTAILEDHIRKEEMLSLLSQNPSHE